MPSVSGNLATNKITLQAHGPVDTGNLVMEVANSSFTMSMGSNILMTVAPEGVEEINGSSTSTPSTLTINRDTIIDGTLSVSDGLTVPNLTVSHDLNIAGNFNIAGNITLSPPSLVCPGVEMASSYPWEFVDENNFKTWRFVIKNFNGTVFSPTQVAAIAAKVEKFINSVVFLSWRIKVKIEAPVLPTIAQLEAGDVAQRFGNYMQSSLPLQDTYIPIFLIDEFKSSHVANNFATAIHGLTGATIDTNKTCSFWMDSTWSWLPGFAPMGFPFVVIPSGSTATGNGIAARVASNVTNGDGPTTFSQVLCHTLASHIISIVVNPTTTNYVITGDSIGNYVPSYDLTYKSIINFKKDPVEPFERGLDNIVTFEGYSMPNFAYPAYFYPHNDSGIYDYLGKTNAPFAPWKGKQMLMYQVNTGGDSSGTMVLSDMSHAYLFRDSTDSANHLRLSVNGGLYDCKSWGWSSYTLAGGVSRSPTVTTKQMYLHVTPPAFDRSLPQLNKTYYIDPEDNVLTMRFGIVNFTPSKVDPVYLDSVLPLMEAELRRIYTNHWNIKCKFVANYTVHTNADQPTYDGTWIPYFICATEQFNFDSFGALAAYSGAFNTCMTYNNFSGSLIGEYLWDWKDASNNVIISVPNLPLGCPYIMQPTAGFAGVTTMTTSVGGFSQDSYIIGGTKFGLQHPLPQAAVGLQEIIIQDIASPDANLTNEKLNGKIAVLQFGISGITNTYKTRTIQACEAAGAIGIILIQTYATLNTGSAAIQTSHIQGYLLNQTQGTTFLSLLRANPLMTVTMSAERPNQFNNLRATYIISHEATEESRDPAYAEYIISMAFPTLDASGNSNGNGALVGNQIQNADEIERFNPIVTDGVNFAILNAYPLPAYFVPNLKFQSYDMTGASIRPLLPMSRNQQFFQLERAATYTPNDGSVAYQIDTGMRAGGGVMSGFESGNSPWDFVDGGNMFDRHTWYPPYTNYVDYWVDGKAFSIFGSTNQIGPVSRVYTETLKTDNVLLLDNFKGYLQG